MIEKIISEQLGVDIDAVTDDKNLMDDLGADSLDTVQLVMDIEDENNNCLQHLHSLSTLSFLQPTTPRMGIAAQQTSAFFTGSIQLFDLLLSAQSALLVR